MRRLDVPALIVLLLIVLTACSAPSKNVQPVDTVVPTDELIHLDTLPTTTPQPTPTPVVAKTPKPWQTMTTVPTATSVPSLTPMPTTNATLTPMGVKIEKQKDGASLITDYDNKLQFKAPAGWIITTLKGKAPIDVLSTLGKSVPNINRTNTFLNVLAPNISVIGLNTSTSATGLGYPMLMRLATLSDPGKSLMQIDIAAKSVRTALEKAGYKITNSSSKTYANGIKAAVIDVTEEFPIRQNDQFVTLTVFTRVVVFQSAGKLIVFSAAGPSKLSDETMTAIDKMVSSVTFLK